MQAKLRAALVALRDQRGGRAGLIGFHGSDCIESESEPFSMPNHILGDVMCNRASTARHRARQITRVYTIGYVTDCGDHLKSRVFTLMESMRRSGT